MTDPRPGLPTPSAGDDVPPWTRVLAVLRGLGTRTGLASVPLGVLLAFLIPRLGGSTAPGVTVALAGAVLLVGTGLLSAIPGGPTLPVRTIASPVVGRWQCLNSPSSRVPSHGTHTLGQTFAVDMVLEPQDGSRPRFGDGPSFRRPDDYPAFGVVVASPVDGTVVAVHDGSRDHRARSGWLGYVYLLVEGIVREAGGPRRMVGNHVSVCTKDGAVAVLAHLQRGSIGVTLGQEVAAGTIVGRCGNSGNSSEPHVHLQLCDRSRLTVAQGLPLRLRDTVDDVGRPLDELPPDGGIFIARS